MERLACDCSLIRVVLDCDSPVVCDAEALSEGLVSLSRSIDMLEVRFSRLAGFHARLGVWEREGFLSPYQWLRGV